EMAMSPGILRVALKVKPAWVCLVPERRQELTTEGGLNVKINLKKISAGIERLHGAGISVSLFISPNKESVHLSREVGADAVEFHTGSYARKWGKLSVEKEMKALQTAAQEAASAGLLVNAGHGLDYKNVGALKRLHPFNEYNIGFAIVARAI